MLLLALSPLAVVEAFSPPCLSASFLPRLVVALERVAAPDVHRQRAKGKGNLTTGTWTSSHIALREWGRRGMVVAAGRGRRARRKRSTGPLIFPSTAAGRSRFRFRMWAGNIRALPRRCDSLHYPCGCVMCVNGCVHARKAESMRYAYTGICMPRTLAVDVHGANM